MEINSYLSEIEHPVRSVVSIVWTEHREVEGLENRVMKLNAEVYDGYRRAGAWSDSEYADDVIAGARMH
jgi:hypothetical protein